MNIEVTYGLSHAQSDKNNRQASSAEAANGHFLAQG